LGSQRRASAVAKNLTLVVQSLQIGQISLEKVTITARDASWRADPPLALEASAASLEAVLVESALCHLVAGVQAGPVTHLQAQLLRGRIRFTGRYGPVPFELLAEPAIALGTRIALKVLQGNVVGLPLPGFGLDQVAALINSRLSQLTDVGRIIPQAQITGVKVDPGRMTITLEASPAMIELQGRGKSEAPTLLSGT